MLKNKTWLSILIICLVSLCLWIQGDSVHGDDDTEHEPDNPGIKEEQTAEGDLGMVVTAHPLASKVGADVLKNGGNAVDAAVAIQLALNVAEPMMSGIGGGGFFMYYDAETEDISIINSRERAPSEATPDMFIDQSETVTGKGKFLLGANELNANGGGEFHIDEIKIDDLQEQNNNTPAFHYTYAGTEGKPWSEEYFALNESGTTFTLDESGGKINFASERTSFGQATAVMDSLEDSELFMHFRTDDPGHDRRLRLWLRADDYRSTESTYVKNGYGIEIDTHQNELKLIQAKDAANSILDTIKLESTTDWQSLRFRVENDELKVRVWQDDEEPEEWDIDTVAGRVMPFSERVQSGKSVGIPGTLKGLEKALDNWGSKPLEKLIQPAIDMADNGVEVNWVLENAISENAEKLSRSAASEVFLPNGEPLREGELLVQEDLANTYRLIAEQGTDALYNGEIGSTMAQVVQEFDGHMIPDDLSQYNVTEHEPIWEDYLGYDIASMPPPSSGGLTMLQMLNMFAEINLTQYDVTSAEKYHHMVEAMHLAYADRAAYMGDPEYVDVPSEGLLHPDYIKQRVQLIDSAKANSNVQPGQPWDFQDGGEAFGPVQEHVQDNQTDGETTHFTVADRWGNLVSFTTTIEQLFGSGIMVPEYGIMLNNELTDFDAVPGGANQVEPNKQPLSSMTPTIILKDNQPFMTIGSPGGATIITSVTQTIVNTIGYQMNLKDAIEEPRIYSDGYPTIRWEYGISNDVRSNLEQMGHAFEENPAEIGNVNSLQFDEDKGVYIGAADSTREGMAIAVSTPSIHYMKELVEQFNRFGDIQRDSDVRQLETHLTTIDHFKRTEKHEKAVKHLKSFSQLIDHLYEQETISHQAYKDLQENTDFLLDDWQ